MELKVTAGRSRIVFSALVLTLILLTVSCMCLISSTSASPLVKLEVSNITSAACESLTVLNPGDGNWIQMVGGEEMSLPAINLVYNIKSTNYTKGDRKIKIIPYVEESEDYSVHYPFSKHSVYYNGDAVTVKVLGERGIAGEKAHIYLIKASPSEVNSVWNSTFDGDIKSLRDLLDKSSDKRKITLDSAGDCTVSFGTLNPGDYVVATTLNASSAQNITFISTTAFEVFKHKSDLELEASAITRTSVSDYSFASGNFNIIGAGADTTYNYAVTLIRKDGRFDLRWDCDETKSELNLKLSDAPLTKSINIFGGPGLENLTLSIIYDWILTFQTASVEKGASGTTYNFSLPVMSMPDGDYYLYAMACSRTSPSRKTFASALAQKPVKIKTLEKPALGLTLTAYPEVIEANGVDTSTITALVTDEFGRGISGIKVIFNTSLGTIGSPKTTSDEGIATTTLTSSTSPGTAVVKGRVDLKDVLVNDTVLVALVRTDVVEKDNVTEIGLNQTYTSSDACVGTIKSCIDVVFDKLLRNVRLETTQSDDTDFIDPKLKYTIADALEAVFSLEDISASDAKSMTPVVIQSKLYAKNLTKEDVKEVPIEITIGKEWFKDVTQENVNNLRIFKINVTTGEVESEDITKVAETDTNVTFLATFDHFCVFALVARPPVAAPPPLIVRPRGARPTPTPELEVLPPVPRDTTPPIISNITVTIEDSVIISWDTNEKSDSQVKCGIKSGQYTIEEYAPQYVLFHIISLKQIRLKNIFENTTYYFVVNSTDPSGNSAQTEEYMFILTPSERKRAIMPFILQLPPILYPHMWWILFAIIIALIIILVTLPRRKSRQTLNSLIGKPVGTEILMYLYTTFPNASRSVDISGRTGIDLNGVLEALYTMSNKNKLESLLGIGLVDKVEYEGEARYRISKRGKSLMDGLK
ncbi:MAG: TIGR04279 domain-containing protein [Methanophagales archaeon]|nr:TIGR04279 domain-containing protein [Methanophagales archaeon]